MTKTKNPSSNNKYAPTFFPVLIPSGKKIEASCFFIRHRKNHAGRMYTRSEPVSAPVRPKHVARFGITMESPKDVPTRNTVSKTKYTLGFKWRTQGGHRCNALRSKIWKQFRHGNKSKGKDMTMHIIIPIEPLDMKRFLCILTFEVSCSPGESWL